MTEIYLVRHGETEYNRDGILQGWVDSPLTEKGRENAFNNGMSLLKLGVAEKLTRIISSDFPRAVETTKIIRATIRREDITISQDSDFREINRGTIDGKFIADYQEAIEKCKTDLNLPFPNGESYYELQQRALNGLRKLFVNYSREVLLLVCHGAFINSIHRFYNNIQGYGDFIVTHNYLGRILIENGEFKEHTILSN